MAPVTPLALPVQGNALLKLSGSISSPTGKCSFHASTWRMFLLKSFKWLEENWRHTEHSAYQVTACPYSAMTHKGKICISAQNVTRTSQTDLFVT